ncbi:carbohydrate ABC transporter permease, partial [Rhizobium leguminosarum]|nr:carbohydrate ABC transporter permease [Rhizobium leguminosarum]
MAYSVLSDVTTKTKATAAADRARRDPMRWVVLAILILLLAFTLFPFFLALLNA